MSHHPPSTIHPAAPKQPPARNRRQWVSQLDTWVVSISTHHLCNCFKLVFSFSQNCGSNDELEYIYAVAHQNIGDSKVLFYTLSAHLIDKCFEMLDETELLNPDWFWIGTHSYTLTSFIKLKPLALIHCHWLCDIHQANTSPTYYIRYQISSVKRTWHCLW